VHAHLETPVLRLADVAAARILERAEVPAERHLLLVGQLLVVEDEHRIAVHAGLDRRDLVARKRSGDVDTRYLAHEDGMDLPDRNTHRDRASPMRASAEP